MCDFRLRCVCSINVIGQKKVQIFFLSFSLLSAVINLSKLLTCFFNLIVTIQLDCLFSGPHCKDCFMKEMTHYGAIIINTLMWFN